MATEQENLVLNVTLVDNASAGLDKLNQQLKQLGGEQHASAQGKLRTNFAGVQNAIKPLVGDFSRLSTSMTGVTKSAMSMIPALAGVGTAVLGVGGVLMAALIPIKRFAAEMSDLGQLARETGHNAATIKMFREEFGKLFGSQGIALADTTLRGLQRSMTDILNPASKLRQELEQGARHTPEMRENMDKLINSLKDAAQKGDTTEFFNLFEEGMDNMRKNISAMPNRGPVVAAQWVNDLNKLAGIPEAVAATHVKLKGPTQEAIRNTQALIEQSTQLTRSFNSMSVSVGRISDSLSAIALGFGPVVKGAQLLADALERIANAADRWARTRTGNLTPEEKAEQERLTEDIFRNAPQYPGRGVPPPVVKPQSQVSPNNNTAANEESKRRLIEEENKRMAELTAGLKELSDLTRVPTDRPQGQGFHNTPRGGAKGESNPMKIPRGIKQPGGGAAAEARDNIDLSTPPPGALTALEVARRHLGAHELKDTARLQQFMKEQGFGVNPKTTAWCATYANSILTAGGHEPSSPLSKSGAAAGSFVPQYDKKGNKLSEGYGDAATIVDVESGYGTYVGVLKGESPRTHVEGKHVALLTGQTRIDPKTGKLQLQMRGGNQPEEGAKGTYTGEGLVVSDIWYDADKLHLRHAPSSAGELKSLGIGGDTQIAGGPELIKSQRERAQDALKDVRKHLADQEQGRDPRRIQRALESIAPGSDEEWELRRQRALKESGPGYSEREEAQPPEGYGPGVGLPNPGEIEGIIRRGGGRSGKTEEDIRKSEEYYSQPDWMTKGHQLGIEQRSSLDRKILDRTMGDEVSNHTVEGSANIDINVKRSGKANDKVSSLFKMPKMERQSSGTPASRGPAEDISGGSNSGIYT